jgi:parallel beta-helix repeat protein
MTWCVRFGVGVYLLAVLASVASAQSSPRGPQPAIACPAGAIEVWPGQSIQAAVNGAATGATICLRAGTHTINASITPKTGQVIMGEFGAAIDGTGWVSTDSTAAGIRAHNQDIDHVTIRNLVIRNMPQKCIHAFRDFSSGWTVEYSEIHGCRDGVSLSTGATLRHNYIHHNIGDPTHADAGQRGGGYVFNEGTGILVAHNEISFNGPEQKSIDIGTIIWRDNFVHHNYAAGIWVDGNGNGSIIENNRVEDQIIGIWYEAAQGGIIRHNTIRRHREQGIFLSTAKTTDVYGNTLEHNGFGIHIYADLDVVGLYAWSADLANNTIHHNTITTGPTHYAALFSHRGSATSATPYITNAKNNRFDFNTYLTDALTDTDWFWVTPKDWTWWQGFGQDPAGSVALVGSVPVPSPIIVQVSPQGDVQAALNACQPGGIVQLQAGATYTGVWTFPAKAAPGCTLTSSATLPARRITPGDSLLLPIVRSGNTGTPLVLFSSANWTLDGLAVEPPLVGDTAMVAIQDSTNITLDRLLLVVPDGKQLKRAIMGNGNGITLTRSHCAGVWRDGVDSQCFAAWDGAGPYTITDNFLEAASENVMFGGADQKTADRIPADIRIEGNLFTKPLAWKGLHRNVKTILELKAAKRVTVRNNVFERSWVDGQGGVGILINPMNDLGLSDWTVVEDVLIETNTIRDVVDCFGIVGRDTNHGSGQTTRITITGNTCQGVSNRFMNIADDVGVLSVAKNVSDNPSYAALLWGAGYAVRDLVWRDNTLTNPQIAGDGVSFAETLPRYVEVFNGTPTTPTPPPVPPVNVCEADPITLTVTAWPSKNRKTRADFEVSSPRGTATVTFSFMGQVAVSATATDGTCSVTVTR